MNTVISHIDELKKLNRKLFTENLHLKGLVADIEAVEKPIWLDDWLEGDIDIYLHYNLRKDIMTVQLKKFISGLLAVVDG